jgi:hypothetical protein
MVVDWPYNKKLLLIIKNKIITFFILTSLRLFLEKSIVLYFSINFQKQNNIPATSYLLPLFYSKSNLVAAHKKGY